MGLLFAKGEGSKDALPFSKFKLLALALVCGLPATVLAMFAYALFLFVAFGGADWVSIETSVVVVASAMAAFSLFQFWKLVARTVSSRPFEFALGYRVGITCGILSMLPLLFLSPPFLLVAVPVIFCTKRMVQLQLSLFADSSERLS